MKKEQKEAIEAVATNRKARHNFHILETFEAGILLEGPEVKSLRFKQADINQSFARAEENGEIYIYGMYIAPYIFNTLKEIDPTRKRKLLLKSGEIKKISAAASVKGAAIPVLEVYFKHGWAKALIALAKGKRAPDKHEDIKKKETDREMRREFREKFKG